MIENSVEIARPPLEVFDRCSDLSNELEWTPGSMQAVERLTDGPIGVGTRYRAVWRQGGANTVEYTRYERPTWWEARSDSKAFGIVFTARVEPAGTGSRLVVRMDLRPHGVTRLIGPILLRVMQRQEVLNLAAVKRWMESSGV